MPTNQLAMLVTPFLLVIVSRIELKNSCWIMSLSCYFEETCSVLFPCDILSSI